jgi:hypothetical protein
MAVVAPTLFATITTSPLVGTSMLNVMFRPDITDPGPPETADLGESFAEVLASYAKRHDHRVDPMPREPRIVSSAL